MLSGDDGLNHLAQRNGVGYMELHGCGVGCGDLESHELSAEIQEIIWIQIRMEGKFI